jgi:hypothetical protein
MNNNGRRVDGGGFYERTRDGLVPTEPAVPDVWICRRVADYPHGQAPVAAAIGGCHECGEPIAYNPARVPTVPPSTPRICMQCARIEPLPIEPAS